MHPNAELITRFYSAFQEKNAGEMAACYHPQVEFSDPVFRGLKGDEAGAMWAMLCESGRDLVIEFKDVTADDTSGSAHWEAWYTFSTGRKVHNVIDAAFKFEDGLIRDHRDAFNFWRWSRMALGTTGLLLGWTPFLRGKVSEQAKGRLAKHMTKEA